MRGKKGLSTVVTTLIIVLLVLAAIGIIWNPIKNLLTQSTESFDQTKCFDMDVKATRIIDNLDGTYNVTLSRKLTGENSIGAKIIFFTDTDASAAINFPEMLVTSQPIMTRQVDPAFNNATSVRVNAFFLDEATNEEKLCETSTEFAFS